MELLKHQAPLEFKHDDVTFFIKPHASSGDRLEILMSASVDNSGKLVSSKADYVRALIRRFVVGWNGVTQGGKEVAYSFELLDQALPNAMGDIMLMLGNFIIEKTDINRTDKELKNESRRQPTGVPA